MTRMKESERCPWQVEEETQRQEESQEAAKSISPGSREFQGGGGSQQNTTQLSQIWKVYIGLGGHT